MLDKTALIVTVRRATGYQRSPNPPVDLIRRIHFGPLKTPGDSPGILYPSPGRRQPRRHPVEHVNILTNGRVSRIAPYLHYGTFYIHKADIIRRVIQAIMTLPPCLDADLFGKIKQKDI
jgi:hypothetical protein